MPYIRIIIHAVWATKSRRPLMDKENKDKICKHIRANAQDKQIHVMNINGWKNHIHGLISLSSSQNIATVMNLIKGESSYWANKNLKWKEKFGWQDEYFAVSVSQSHIDTVSRYIDRQEEHHRKKTFQEEYDEFMKKYNFEK